MAETCKCGHSADEHASSLMAPCQVKRCRCPYLDIVEEGTDG